MMYISTIDSIDRIWMNMGFSIIFPFSECFFLVFHILSSPGWLWLYLKIATQNLADFSISLRLQFGSPCLNLGIHPKNVLQINARNHSYHRGGTPQKMVSFRSFSSGAVPGDAGSRQLGGPGGTAVHVAIVVFSCQAPCLAFVPYPWASSWVYFDGICMYNLIRCASNWHFLGRLSWYPPNHIHIWVADKIDFYSQGTWPKWAVPYRLWRFVLPCYV